MWRGLPHAVKAAAIYALLAVGGRSARLVTLKGVKSPGRAGIDPDRHAHQRNWGPEVQDEGFTSSFPPSYFSNPYFGQFAFENSEEGNILLENFYNIMYIGTVDIGSPPQEMRVIFDTGSSDIWVPGSNCYMCGNVHLFEGTESSTYSTIYEQNKPKQFEIDYGSGSVVGVEATDSVHLAGFELTDVVFGEVWYEDQAIRNIGIEGIVGLGFSGLSVITQPTVLELLRDQEPNLDSLFSVYLSTDPFDEEKPSHILFGAYDLSIVGDGATLHYTPVVAESFDSLSYWAISITGFEILGTGMSSSTHAVYTECVNGCVGIVDTGTSSISIPIYSYIDIVNTITKGMSCYPGYCFNVELSDFPDLILSVYPDNRLPLKNTDYVVCNDNRQCALKFTPSYISSFWVLGAPFLEAYYTVFDFGRLRIGFACNGECEGGSWHGTGGLFEVEGSTDWSKWIFRTTGVLALIGVVFIFVSNTEVGKRILNRPISSERQELRGSNDTEEVNKYGSSADPERL